MEYLLLIVFVITMISIFLGSKLPRTSRFDQVILFFLCFVSFHVLYTFIYETLSLPVYADLCFPFGLVYGPIFYFALNTAVGSHVSFRKAWTHFIPFLLFLVSFFFLVFSISYRAAYYQVHLETLYSLVPISMIGYLFMAFVSNRKRTQLLGKATRIVTIGVTMMATIAFVILIMTVLPIERTQEALRNIPRFMIYTAILLQVTAILQYQIGRFVKDLSAEQNPVDTVSFLQGDKTPLYEKSLITDEAMDIYEDKLRKVMNLRLLQNTELTLEGLAKQINAPKHHLTQLLNLRKKKTFNQYINGLRIKYACELLERNPRAYSIEELAYKCGFNSKVSFNRNFKSITGFTPSEYRGQL